MVQYRARAHFGFRSVLDSIFSNILPGNVKNLSRQSQLSEDLPVVAEDSTLLLSPAYFVE
jgi:hypothetical protein